MTFWVADAYGPSVTLCDECAMKSIAALALTYSELREARTPSEALSILDAMRTIAGVDIPLPYREGEGPCQACRTAVVA